MIRFLSAALAAIMLLTAHVAHAADVKPLINDAGKIRPVHAGETVGAANGGTGCSTASGTCLDNITAFGSLGYVVRTGSGTYSFISTTNGILRGHLAQAAANTVLGNFTGSTANVADNALTSCPDSGGNHLNYVSGTGITCGTSGTGITALTGDATASGPGSAGITFTTVNSNTGTWGDATHVPQLTVNAKGLVTSVSSVAISGGGGGGMGTLHAETVTTGSATSVTVSSIPGTYRNMMIMVNARGTTAAATTILKMQFNGDTGANYDRIYVAGIGNTASAAQAPSAETFVTVVDMPAATASSGASSASIITIPNYSGAVFHKAVKVASGSKWGTSTGQQEDLELFVLWRNTAAVTSVTLFPTAGAFVDGTVVDIYLMLFLIPAYRRRRPANDSGLTEPDRLAA